MKKRGGDKEKKVRKKCLNERETLSYEQQILDNNRQLSRLSSRNEELEIEVKNLTKKFEQLKEDRSDIVAHMKRDLEGKIEETRELNERLLAMEELRKQEQAEYKKKENAMEQEYRTMESNLSAEVKLTAGKLNALEDWRLARLDLMHKFEEQEEEMAKQEELHKTTLYETEKSVIVAKAKMQKEMEERLKQLAREFKEATNIRIADMMHNAVRRNIALNHELNSMLKVCQDLETRSAECKETDRVLRLQCELLEGEAKVAQEDALRHRRAMHELAQGHVDTILEYGQIQRENMRLGNYEQTMNQYKARCKQSEEKIKVLERHLQETKEAREEVLIEVRKKCEEFDNLNKVLNDAKKCVLEALQLQEHVCTSDTCTLCCADQKQKLIYSLQNILEKHNIFDIIEDDDTQMEKTGPKSLENSDIMESEGKGGNIVRRPGIVLNDDLEFWMTRFPAPLKNVPIIHLAIPGSHNTMTYTIERHNDVGPDEPAFVRTLGRYCSFVAKPIILNWSITQRDDIKQQLNGGIRYLDLRVATKPRTSNIYFLHGLYGAEVSKPLLDVADWLTLHANEIVILDFQHFYAFTDQDHHRLIDKIIQIFRGKLCPVSSRFDHITLQWLVLKRYQVFVIYRNVYARNYANLWPSGLWRTVWPNTVRVDELIDFLNIELQSRSLDIAFVSQCLLTPDTPYVVKHLCGTLQRDLAPRCQKAILSWISQKQPGRGGLNIVIADFVSDSNFLFSKTVIQSNTKLMHSPEIP